MLPVPQLPLRAGDGIRTRSAEASPWKGDEQPVAQHPHVARLLDGARRPLPRICRLLR